MSEREYLLWAHDREMWWRPNASGYTSVLAEAGRYSQAEALGYVLRSAQAGTLDEATCMVVAPPRVAPEDAAWALLSAVA